MPDKERRKYHRIDSLNLLSYIVMDENGQIVSQGVGRTLNVSEGGILLETHVSIDPKHKVSLFVALEDDLVDIAGKVIHSQKGQEGKYCTGISFIEPNEAAHRILSQFIQGAGKKT